MAPVVRRHRRRKQGMLNEPRKPLTRRDIMSLNAALEPMFIRAKSRLMRVVRPME